MLVSAGVVVDQVHVEVVRDILVDSSEETQELLVPVPGLALGDHRTGGHVQGGKQWVLPSRMVSWGLPRRSPDPSETAAASEDRLQSKDRPRRHTDFSCYLRDCTRGRVCPFLASRSLKASAKSRAIGNWVSIKALCISDVQRQLGVAEQFMAGLG